MPGAILGVFYPLDPLNCYHAHFVCVMCCGVSSDSRPPCEWVTSAGSCPHSPALLLYRTAPAELISSLQKSNLRRDEAMGLVPSHSTVGVGRKRRECGSRDPALSSHTILSCENGTPTQASDTDTKTRVSCWESLATKVERGRRLRLTNMNRQFLHTQLSCWDIWIPVFSPVTSESGCWEPCCLGTSGLLPAMNPTVLELIWNPHSIQFSTNHGPRQACPGVSSPPEWGRCSSYRIVKTGLSFTVGGNAKWKSHCGRQWWFLQN